MEPSIILAVTWLSPSCRQLLSKARLMAISSDYPCIEGIHLFQAAANTPRSKAGRLIPIYARKILNQISDIPVPDTNTEETQFVPISNHIQESCRALSNSGQLILPDHLLKEIFARDQGTQNTIKDLLGPELSNAMHSRMMLSGFKRNERSELLRIKERMEKHEYAESLRC